MDHNGSIDAFDDVIVCEKSWVEVMNCQRSSSNLDMIPSSPRSWQAMLSGLLATKDVCIEFLSAISSD